MNIEYVLITPLRARVLLETNTQNRKLKPATVDMYVEDIRTGRWNDNNMEPIVINKLNVMENGQHRLHAIIKSNVPKRFLLITGSEPAAETYDRGAPRTTSDALKISGLVNTRCLNMKVSAVRLIASLGFGIKKISDKTIENYILDHEADLSKAISIVGSGRNTAISKKKEFILAAYCAIRCSIPEDELRDFFTVVNTGFMDQNWQSSAVILRNKILEFKTSGAGGSYSRSFYLTTEYALRDYLKMVPRKQKYYISDSSKSIFLQSVAEKDRDYFVTEED